MSVKSFIWWKTLHVIRDHGVLQNRNSAYTGPL